MKLTFQPNTFLLFGAFLFLTTTSLKAQCNFSNQTERLEHAAIKAIYEQNPKDFFSFNMRDFVNGQICNICDVPEVYCENGQTIGLFLMGKNLMTIPRSIATFSDLRFVFLNNNQLSCLPKELALVCSNNTIDLILEGNPIFNTTGFFDFCSNPRDICIPSLSFPACEMIDFINYLDTVYIIGLGDGYHKVDIIGAPTNWKVLPICEYCNDIQLVNNLSPGEYTLKINLTKANGKSCYREEKITITSNQNTSPTSSANIGAVNCDNIGFEVIKGDLYIDGLTAHYNKVEYIGENTNWKVMLACDGNCLEETLIPSLKTGIYTIKLFQVDEFGNNCYREKVIIVEEYETTTPNNVFEAINCEELKFEVVQNEVYITGLTTVYNKVEYIGANTNWKVITECNGTCSSMHLVAGLTTGDYTFKVFQADKFGDNCYREESITINNEDLPYPSEQTGALNCDNLIFGDLAGQIYIDGLTAAYNKVEYIGAGTNWKVKTLCDGDCEPIEYINELPQGAYTVKVNQKEEQTQSVHRPQVGGHGNYYYKEAWIQVRANGRNSKQQIEAKLYPNPASSHIQLNTTAFQGKKGQLYIYNTLGHLVKQVAVNSKEEAIFIDLSDFENGMYWLSIQLEKSPPVNGRFIVEHLR